MPISYVSGSGDSTKKTTTPAFNPYSFNNPNLPSWLNQWVTDVTNNQIREQIGLPPEYAIPKVTSATPYFKSPVVTPTLPAEETNTGNQLFPGQFGNSPKGTPAGNNIASGAVAPTNPNSVMSGTQLSTTAPNTGTIGTDINQSPFSPTAGTRKRTSPNKYFNQRWFGTKEIA